MGNGGRGRELVVRAARSRIALEQRDEPIHPISRLALQLSHLNTLTSGLLLNIERHVARFANDRRDVNGFLDSHGEEVAERYLELGGEGDEGR